MRSDQRAANALRPISLERHYTCHAEGSVLVSFGRTKVLCNASVSESVPRFLKGSGQGWVTAEYSMLPRATHDRCDREAARGKQSGRTHEIQRLIGRALRAAVNLKFLKEHTITVDCDVIQADGGTRTAAITGGCVALYDALTTLKPKLDHDPFEQFVAAVSVGICDGQPVCDLDYTEDSQAETDMNVVMTQAGEFIEVQGTAENAAFNRQALDQMLELAEGGVQALIKEQQKALGLL